MATAEVRIGIGTPPSTGNPTQITGALLQQIELYWLRDVVNRLWAAELRERAPVRTGRLRNSIRPGRYPAGFSVEMAFYGPFADREAPGVQDFIRRGFDEALTLAAMSGATRARLQHLVNETVRCMRPLVFTGLRADEVAEAINAEFFRCLRIVAARLAGGLA